MTDERYTDNEVWELIPACFSRRMSQVDQRAAACDLYTHYCAQVKNTLQNLELSGPETCCLFMILGISDCWNPR